MKPSSLARRAQFLSSRWLLRPPRALPRRQPVPEPQRHPFLMISQVQRSGGSMFAQLLDDHPDLLVFPGEIHIAKPKRDWPRLSPGHPPSVCFRKLVDHRCIEYAREGFYKTIRGRQRMNFAYDVALHQDLFCALFRARRPATPRDILDLFFTSFFASWDRGGNDPAAPSPVRYYAGFAAGMAANGEAVDRYFRDYPDGHLVSIVRDPRNWLPSAVNKPKSWRKFSDSEKALGVWRRSTEAMRRNAERYPGKVTLIDFEHLIADTGSVMERFCRRLDLPYDPALLTPTFNGRPLESNSTFGSVKGYVDDSVLERDMATAPGLDACVALYEDLRRSTLLADESPGQAA